MSLLAPLRSAIRAWPPRAVVVIAACSAIAALAAAGCVIGPKPDDPLDTKGDSGVIADTGAIPSDDSGILLDAGGGVPDGTSDGLDAVADGAPSDAPTACPDGATDADDGGDAPTGCPDAGGETGGDGGEEGGADATQVDGSAG